MLESYPVNIHKNWKIVRKLETTERIKIEIEKILIKLLIAMNDDKTNYV
jgi:hypothetical protein